jgi:hypothetical protein
VSVEQRARQVARGRAQGGEGGAPRRARRQRQPVLISSAAKRPPGSRHRSRCTTDGPRG